MRRLQRGTKFNMFYKHVYFQPPRCISGPVKLVYRCSRCKGSPSHHLHPCQSQCLYNCNEARTENLHLSTLMLTLPFCLLFWLLPLPTVGEDGRGHMMRLDTDIILTHVWMNLAACSTLLCLSLWCMNARKMFLSLLVIGWRGEARRRPPPPVRSLPEPSSPLSTSRGQC